jgi:hypothetical protein
MFEAPRKEAAVANYQEEESPLQRATKAEKTAQLAKIAPLSKRIRDADLSLQGWQTVVRADEAFLQEVNSEVDKITDEDGWDDWIDEWPANEAALKKQKTLLAAKLRQVGDLSARWTKFQAKQQAITNKADKGWNEFRDSEISIQPLYNYLDEHHPRKAEKEQASDARHAKYYEIVAEREKHKAATQQIDTIIVETTTPYSNYYKLLTDPDVRYIQDAFPIDQALDFKRHGVRFKDFRFDQYADHNLDPSRSQDNFGSGACNSIDKLVHWDDQERFFKPEKQTDNASLAIAALGIDAKAPRYGNRNIASHTISKALKLEVIPEARFMLHKGKLGLLMDAAEGKSPAHKSADRTTWLRDKPWQGDQPPPELVANLHGQLNALEWCDIMTGQADRHVENYHVKVEGNGVKVTGIDNDRAFGSAQGNIMQPRSGIYGFESVGTPKLIDKSIYDRLIKMDFKRDLLPGLGGLLTEAEINASRQRFDAVNTAARGLNDKFVVKDWDACRSPDERKLTATEYLAEQETGSLFARDFAQFFPNSGKRPDPPKDGAKK